MSSAKLLPRILGAILVLFVVVTAWAVTVNGALEPAKLDVEYFNSGAGDGLLLLRFFLALCVSALSIAWALQKTSALRRLARLALVPTVFLVLIGSVTVLTRYAPGYSETGFLDLLRAHQAGHPMTKAGVAARLGKPLMTASRPGGATTWSYTFMPSGGFGWPKRTFTFDSQGVLVDMLFLDEP
jgi:hypothetical protein